MPNLTSSYSKMYTLTMGINNRGLSIVEVLMSFSLLSIIGVSFMYFNEEQSKVNRDIEDQININDFVSQARAILSEPRACVDTLNGIPIHSNSSQQINSIKGSVKVPYSNPLSWINFTYKDSQTYLNSQKFVFIESMTVKYPATYKGEIELELKFNKKNYSNSNLQSVIRSIYLNTVPHKTIPGKIGHCYAAGVQMANWPSMCTTLGGTYDSTTNQCKGLFKVDFSSQVTPDRDHFEKLEYNNGVVKIVIL